MTLDAIRLILSVIIGGLAVDLSIRLLARVHPSSYFGLSELIRGLDRRLSWRGFALRLAIPLIFGAIVGSLNPEARGAAGAASAAVGALLVVWPPLIYDHLLPDGTWRYKNEVRLIYVLYFCAYLLLGFAGGSLAGRAIEEFAPSSIARWFAEAEIPTSTEVLGGLLAWAVGTLALYIVRRFAERVKKDSR